MQLPIIKNFEELSDTPLRRDAIRILEAGYQAVMTEVVMKEEIELKEDTICIKDTNICLSDFRKIYFVGIGKCAVDASQVLETMIGKFIARGIVIDVKSGVFEKIESYVGTHPFPSDVNVAATKEVVSMLSNLDARDIVFVVVSGGGSSLLCLPHESSCKQLELMTHKLWKCGADIHEVNVMRKHTSDIQGGQLAKLAYPATVVSFIISDVPGNDMGVIASGPTVRDTSTVEDARNIMKKYGLENDPELSGIVLTETPKEEIYFQKVTNIMLATNERALIAMKSMSEVLGYYAEVKETNMQGEASELGKKFATQAMPKRSCFIYGGETTVTGGGGGEGGRNQELALSALIHVPVGRVVVAAASDGWDNGNIAGAIADASLRETAEHLGMPAQKYLQEHNSHSFWDNMSGAIRTGKTGTNVADFCIILSH